VQRQIVIHGAREHNLKNLSLEIPRDKLVVITGLSGSGKSSLAFATIYAEGQRRYLESLSAYARQFLEQLRKPEVDSIDGLSPAISIEQKSISRSPRSTVGTVTEIYDFLRLLYSRLGVPHCASCKREIRSQSIQQIVQQIMAETPGSRFSVLAPIARGKKGEFQKELLELSSQGFVRARIDGEEVSLAEPVKLKKTLRHDVSIYVDRLVHKPGIENRLAEALEIAVKLAEGLVEVAFLSGEPPRLFSTRYACPDCGTSIPDLEPRNFSFNSSHGACPACSGLGSERFLDPEKIVPDTKRSLRDGAVLPWSRKPKSWLERVLAGLSDRYRFSLDAPFASLPESVQTLIFHGSGSEEVTFKVARAGASETFTQRFHGVIAGLQEEISLATSPEDADAAAYLSYRPCEKCHGSRLKPEMLAVLVGGKSIAEITELSVERCLPLLESLQFSKRDVLVAEPICKEIHSRLRFLLDVGLGYLSLSRSAHTLSGGESQRIRLATQIGSALVGVLYVLDEPSIGLHQRDNARLIGTLQQLRDLGNSVLVVEHDQETIESADHVLDLGPGAGVHGGSLVFQGSPAQLVESDSLTGRFLAGVTSIPVPSGRRPPNRERIMELRKTTLHNLRSADVTIPLGLFVCVTGVSGSGKSSLVIDTLLPALEHHFGGRPIPPQCQVGEIRGLEHLDRVIHVDQSPIGRTPRSNPATYTGLFSEIRNLFSGLPEARARGYTPGRFSFNVAGGRCETCAGDGTLRISMSFLPDVFVECETCRSRRYNHETLEVAYRGKSIADVLAMNIEQALEFFEKVPALKSKLQVLADVGLGYVQLGQSAVTLSGGEAQRVKLSRELSKRATGRTLYVLDEPTTGLHFEDVRRLLEMLQRLVGHGNTVIVIEHHLDVIKQADWVLDLGPEGGEGGGSVVAAGTPEDVASTAGSHTGQYLKKALAIAAGKGRPGAKPPAPKITSSREA